MTTSDSGSKVNAAVAGDLAYVAAALRRREVDVTPLPIALYWAIYTAVGFSMIDFIPRYCGVWFGVMGVAGWVFAFWSGARDARKEGVFSSEDGKRQMLHWGTIVLGVAGAWGIVSGGGLRPMVASQITVLAVGLVYFLAGVHFDRRYLPLGLILIAGSIVTGFVDRWAWTGLGAAVAVGLVLLAVVPRRNVASVA